MRISSCSWLYVITLMFLVGSGITHSSDVIHRCMHDELKPNLTILDMPGEAHKDIEDISVEKEKHRRNLGTSTYSAVRITFDISGLSGMDSTKYDFIVNQVLPATQQVFQSFLTVSPLTSPIIMSSKTCYQASVPSQYQTTGASNTDILIFATYDTTTTGLLAWATACSLSSKNNRPVAGQINFAAANINTTAYDFKDILKTVIHEMTHVFTFSPSLFPYYIYSNGSVKTKVSQNATVRGASTTVITLASIVNWAQSFFGCSSYTGVELENQGTSASMGSHWERRVFANELMTSSLTREAVLTNLTLSLYEESGWYVVDYSKADTLFMGQGKGCSFLNSSCIVNNASAFPDYFCAATSNEICTPYYTSKGACGISASVSNISSAFNYWGDSKTGSNDVFDDNCPYVENLSKGMCTNPNNQNTSWSQFFDEQYGGGSRCFVGNFIKSSAAKSYQNFNHAACLSSSCSNGTLTIMVGSTAVACPVAGGNVSITGYTGYITCPPASDFCSRAWINQCGNSCGGVGLCWAGACICPAGTSTSLCNSTGVTTAASTTTTTTTGSSTISSGDSSSTNTTINIDSQPSVSDVNKTSAATKLEIVTTTLFSILTFQLAAL